MCVYGSFSLINFRHWSPEMLRTWLASSFGMGYFFTAQVAAGLCGGLNLSFFIDPASGDALYKVQDFQGTQTGGYPQPTIYR